jgi:hypothetical protein
MATMNPFDLLGDEDAEDPSQLIQKVYAAAPALPKKPVPAAQPKPAVEQQQAAKPAAKLPSKPLPPAQAGELLDWSSFRWVLLGFYLFLIYLEMQSERSINKRLLIGFCCGK